MASNKNAYSYHVTRDGSRVFYGVARNGEPVEVVEVSWLELSFWDAMRCNPKSEKCIGFCLKRAHKNAQLAIEALKKYEGDFDRGE